MTYAVKVYKSTERDSWRHGIIGDGKSFGCIESRELKTLLEVREFANTYAKELFIYDGRLEAQVMEDDDGNTAGSHLMEGFKNGDFDLWLASYSFYVSKVERHEVSHAELVEAFPSLPAESA